MRDSRPSPNHTASYEEIAAEYYDERHITSRNFDAALSALAGSWTCPLPARGPVLELGAGRGTVERYCGVPEHRVVQSDLSWSMLSLQPREPCAQRTQCDAGRLPFADAAFSGVAAFLFDPYNTPPVYHEIARVLADRGVFVGSLPHHTWGCALRRLRGHSLNTARFVTSSGRRIELASFLSPHHEIHARLRRCGLKLISDPDLCLPTGDKIISPDIMDAARALGLEPHQVPVVKLIVARKG